MKATNILVLFALFCLFFGCTVSGPDWGLDYTVEAGRILVCGVRPDSPAARARIIEAPPGYLLIKNIGLVANLDYILKIDGADIGGDTTKIEAALNRKQPGERFTITVDRMGIILILEADL